MQEKKNAPGQGRKGHIIKGTGRRRTFHMYDADAEIAKRLGNGNISEGIRIALAQAKYKPVDS